jgi:hypothetical protein
MKERINISIDSEIAEKLRIEAIKKYGSLRAFSKLIEDMTADRDIKPDIEKVKAERAAYMKMVNMSNIQCSEGKGTCHGGPERFVLCLTCDAVFAITFPLISSCCPTCRRAVLRWIEQTEYSERYQKERALVPPLTAEDKENARAISTAENELFKTDPGEWRRRAADGRIFS